MAKIRQEQIDFTGLSFDDYATKNELSSASGTLDTKITTLSGNFSNYATNSSLNSASGTLDSKINTVSGYLDGKIPTNIPSNLDDLNDVNTSTVASGNYLAYNGANWVPTTPAGGVTDHGLLTGLDDDDHSYIYYNKTIVNTMSGYLKDYTDTSTSTLSGYLASKINISGGLGGVTITTPASGQVLTYNGSIWVNQNAPTGGSSTPWSSGVCLISVTDSFQWAEGNVTLDFAGDNRIIDSGIYNHSRTTNADRITVLASGYYEIYGSLALQYKWNSSDGSNTRYYIGLIKNGTTTFLTGTKRSYKFYKPHTQWQTIVFPGYIINLSVNDYIQVYKNEPDGGTTWPIDFSEDQSWIRIKYLGT